MATTIAGSGLPTHRPNEDIYQLRVWEAHADQLMSAQPPPDTIAGLLRVDPHTHPDERLREELVAERLRTDAAIQISAHVFDVLNHHRGWITTVVNDIVTRWQVHNPDREPHTLMGRLGLADNYLGEVTFERDDDGDEFYRAEFCPEEDVDETLYSRQVWQHHVRELASQR
jgi:hypothetical protein